jgi:hypothetical protein
MERRSVRKNAAIDQLSIQKGPCRQNARSAWIPEYVSNACTGKEKLNNVYENGYQLNLK